MLASHTTGSTPVHQIRLFILCLVSIVFLTCGVAGAGEVDFDGKIVPISEPIKIQYKPYSGTFVSDNQFRVNGKTQNEVMKYDVTIVEKGDGLLYTIKVPTTDKKQKKHVSYTNFVMEIKPDGEIMDLAMEVYDPKGKKIDIPETKEVEGAVKKMADSMCFRFPEQGVKDGDVLYKSSLKGMMDSMGLGSVKEPENGLEMIVAGQTVIDGRACVVGKIPADTQIELNLPKEKVSVSMVCNGYTLFDIKSGYLYNSGVSMDVVMNDKKNKQKIKFEIVSITKLQ